MNFYEDDEATAIAIRCRSNTLKLTTRTDLLMETLNAYSAIQTETKHYFSHFSTTQSSTRMHQNRCVFSIKQDNLKRKETYQVTLLRRPIEPTNRKTAFVTNVEKSTFINVNLKFQIPKTCLKQKKVMQVEG